MGNRVPVRGLDQTETTQPRLMLLLLAVRQVRAPLLMAAAITLLEVLSSTPLAVPSTGRGLVYVLLVAVAASTDGLRAGLVSSLLAVAFAAYAPFLAGSPPDVRDLFALVFATVLTAMVVGGLRDRADGIRRTLESERLDVQSKVRATTEFMNSAGHELRTPIGVITGYLSMLNDGSFGPAPQRWAAVLEIVTRKAEEMVILVEQLLLSGKLEAGTVAATLARFDIRAAVQEAAERANPSASLLGASVNYQLPSLPVVVEADPEHVARILDNLIRNALNFSDRGAWVRITVIEDGDAQVRVEDHGRGIPEEMSERIFERFVHTEYPDRPFAGTGLGLAISRDLAEQQGGTLTLVRSEVGSGSMFVLRLPLAPGQGARTRNALPAGAQTQPDQAGIEAAGEARA